MLHVGMNIADKKAVFAEVRRVLKPGGVFGIYDAMRESSGLRLPGAVVVETATTHIDTGTPTRRRYSSSRISPSPYGA